MIFNTIRASFIISLALASINCAKKDSVQVPDEGPQFSLQSFEVKVNEADKTAMPIKRDDPQSGPQIEIKVADAQSVVSSERKLSCGPLNLVGRTVKSQGSGLLNFRIAEEEFPGLGQLPKQSPCKLQVKLTNKIGSTVLKEVPVILFFDRNPNMEVTRSICGVGTNSFNGNYDFLLETFSIKNTLPYPVGFTFIAGREGKGNVQYMTETRETSTGTRGHPMYSYSKQELKFNSIRIELAGNVLNPQGDYYHQVSFVVPPGEKATVTSYAHMPEYMRRDQQGSITSTIMTITTAAVYLSWVSDWSQDNSLRQWHGFEPTAEDVKVPNVVWVPNPPVMSYVKVDPAFEGNKTVP